MKRLLIGLTIVAAVAACTAEKEQPKVETAEAQSTSKPLEITWQRYVDDTGGTCDRCGTTQAELSKAYEVLKESFAPENIDVVLKDRVLSADACARDLSQSNRIWVAGRPMEDWLGAEVGMSSCGGCCLELARGQAGQGSSPEASCRTIAYEGRVYEAIPSDLIVKAGFMAASEMLGREIKLHCKGLGICTCGGNQAACQGHGASSCESCPNAATCKHRSASFKEPGCAVGGVCTPGQCDPSACGNTKPDESSRQTCPQSKQCSGGACAAGS
jgi:hypothetical protein